MKFLTPGLKKTWKLAALLRGKYKIDSAEANLLVVKDKNLGKNWRIIHYVREF